MSKQAETMNARLKREYRIETKQECPPIPTNRFDWSATFPDYEPGDYVGRGATEADAINDLMGNTE